MFYIVHQGMGFIECIANWWLKFSKEFRVNHDKTMMLFTFGKLRLKKYCLYWNRSKQVLHKHLKYFAIVILDLNHELRLWLQNWSTSYEYQNINNINNCILKGLNMFQRGASQINNAALASSAWFMPELNKHTDTPNTSC